LQAANKTKAANRLMFFMFSRIDSDKNTMNIDYFQQREST